MRWTHHSITAVTITILLSIAALSEAAVIEGRLLGVYYKDRLARGVSLKTRVLLNRGLYKTQIDTEGAFAFLDIPTGVYLLEVQSPDLAYSRVRITVSPDESVHASRVSVGDHWSDQHRSLPMPLTLKPRPRPIHYIPPESAKVVGWFGNPMILLSSFSVLMLLLMPRIVANLDDNALDALRSSYHLSCLPSLPHLPHPHLHPTSSGMPPTVLPSKTMYPSLPPYMVDGALDQYPSSFFRSPAMASSNMLLSASAAPSEPFLVNVDGLPNGSGSGSSSTVTMTASGQYPYGHNLHMPHHQHAPIPVQSKKQK
ncbi:hypothetical protein BG006_000725 [Podila minutissima]|uniref:ER membrane protein complex subunit 7 beta-sandwich domain-containing protein n=1 Tax=Podila minutissima TaxID=64525 RepID=A0A9P5SB13_9FUNG|nr:hypothetical protein BG006_000725 [Podila minutissima]